MMSQFLGVPADAQHSSECNKVKRGSFVLFVWFLPTEIPAKNDIWYAGNLSLNKYSDVEMIYHIYLTNHYFSFLLDWHLSKAQVPVVAAKNHYVSHFYLESFKLFLMAQHLESRSFVSCSLWGGLLFSPLFSFFFLFLSGGF